jgi:V/A-type H+-transporting ATPase subunit I
MFSPLPMQRVSLQTLREAAPQAAVILARSGVFNPETVDVPEGALPDAPGERFREVFLSAKARLLKIQTGGYCPLDVATDLSRVVDLDELERTNIYLGDLWHELSELEEQERVLEERGTSLKQLGESLERFAALDVDLGVLQRPKTFLSVQVGTVQRANLRRLEQAAALAGHFVRPFYETEGVVYLVVAGPAESAHDIEALLQTAEFRAVSVPDEFRDHPEQIRSALAAQAEELKRQNREKAKEIDAVVAKHQDRLAAACRTLAVAEPYAELATRMRAMGGLAVVEGWIPRDDVEALGDALNGGLMAPYVLTARDPRPEERPRVPSVMRHPRWMQPFVALVSNYGIPRYGEIDPTALFTLSFILMFGMMFGDVGHGAVIALAALFFRKRFPEVVPIMVSAGISSVVFGFVYGSIFGNEHILHAFWMAPLSDPLRMLKVALHWGIGFILVANALTFYNLVREGHLGEALFDTRGIAGSLLYLGGIYAGYRWMGSGVFGLQETLAILVPLAVVMTFKWFHFHGPFGERLLVTIVEGFESLMGYLANTLSFLRVAAFALNHVALSLAVFTLAGMLDTAGHWIMIVVGNLFIIVVEGAIVMIQTLRLEYYEGFSRFFRGDGRAFEPLRLEGLVRW